MMRDRALSAFLIALFGISGIAIMTLAWVRPMPASDRILSTLVGSAGLLVVFTQALLLKSSPSREKAERIPVEVATEKQS